MTPHHDNFMTKKPSAIIFDLDGTLVDSARDLSRALNHVLQQNGRSGIDISRVRNMVGDGARALIVKGFTETGTLPSDAEIDAIQTIFLDYYYDTMTAEDILFPGAANVVKKLAAQKIPLGLCTNKALRLTEKLMEEIGLASYFSVLTAGDSFDFRKPDPRHLTATLDRMNCSSQNAIMVGDSASDIIAAQKAAIPVIGVSFGYTKTPIAELNPDIIIDHYDEFFDALDTLIKT